MNLRESGGKMIPGMEHKMWESGVANAAWRRLRVLIWGAINRQDHFDQILAANIQQWGYDVSVYTPGPTTKQAQVHESGADVLVCDLDHASRFSAWQHGLGRLPVESAWLAGNDSRLPRARLLIVLSSSSVPRSTLEQLGAVALLHKPFEMAQLQRYLRVLQRVLLERPATDGSPENAGDAAARQPDGHARHARILVVDDHKEIANTIRECLECETKYEVKVANEGLEALEQCIDWQPDCVVTDLLMPWMNGYQIMRSLSAGTSAYTPAFVVLSALPQSELQMSRDVSIGKEIVFLDKPFQVNQLLQAVEEALAQS